MGGRAQSGAPSVWFAMPKTEKKPSPSPYVPYSIRKCREKLAKAARWVDEAKKHDAERAERPSHADQVKELAECEQIVDDLRADTGYASAHQKLVYDVAVAETKRFNIENPDNNPRQAPTDPSKPQQTPA